MNNKTMKAAVMLKRGDPTSSEVVAVKDVPIPILRKGEILVKVSAAAMNPVDWKMIDGTFPLQRKGFIGVDFSGTVEEIPEGTRTELKVGDKVYGDLGETRPGAFAEYVRVIAGKAAKIPDNLNMLEAASLPCVSLTAYQGILKIGCFKPGHKVCIAGGSGGVGSIAVQISKAMGAGEVWATGSSVDLIQQLGADTVVNYREESVYEALKGKAFDIIFDTVGTVEPWRAAKAGGLKKGGKYLTTAGDGDWSIPRLLLRWGWRYFNHVVGLGPHYTFFRINTKPPAVTDDMKKITEMVESGKIKPILASRAFKLTTDSIHEMFKASMSNRTKGKLVMSIIGESVGHP